MEQATVLALDIGTRKVAGVIMGQSGDGYEMEQALIQEQLPGAMKDGQIHHIPKVAQVIRQITQRLETETGRPFTQAAVAAAGRSLQTAPGRASYTFSGNTRLSIPDVKQLELKAVQDGLSNLASGDHGEEQYLCTGYSVVGYSLDQQPIASLVGQRAETAEVEVIATFLPKLVLSSLMGALERAELEMASLTLEPIAAIHTVVPSSMRMLNIALVDIGAGTSDIAISHKGTIRAYGMVPVAGDEITEGIAQEYLLDFMVAEKLKRQLQGEETVSCADVLGNPLELKCQDVLRLIQPLIEDLAEKIAQAIKELNQGLPKGVILVGGGSLTPGIGEAIAAALDIGEHLVRVGGRNSVAAISGQPEFQGPQAVTPISIAHTHLDGRAMGLEKVVINGRSVQYLALPETTIGDVLIYAGISLQQGTELPLQARINGELRVFDQESGKGGLLCNGTAAALDSQVPPDAVIEITQAGSPRGSLRVSDAVDVSKYTYKLTVNGRSIVLSPQVTVNGEGRPVSYRIQGDDEIWVSHCKTVGQALRFLKLEAPSQLNLMVNGSPHRVALDTSLQINGQSASLDDGLQDGMEIRYSPKYPTVKDVLQSFTAVDSIEVTVQGEQVQLEPALPRVNGRPVEWEYRVSAGDQIEASIGAENRFILSDVFRVFSMDSLKSDPSLKIILNDRPASFTDSLAAGDRIRFSTED